MNIEKLKTNKKDLQEYLRLILIIPEKLNKIDIDIKKELILEIDERILHLSKTITGLINVNNNFYLYPENYLPNRLFEYWAERMCEQFYFYELKNLKKMILDNLALLEKIEPKTKDYKKSVWFLTGIPLATGEAFALHKKHKNDKGVFEIINNKLGSKKTDRTFFSSTINDLKSKITFNVNGKKLPIEKNNKNTFADKDKLQKLHKHLTEKNLPFGAEFLIKYNEIELE